MLQNSQTETIVKTLADAKDSLFQSLESYVDEENFQNATSTMKDISIINQMLAIISNRVHGTQNASTNTNVSTKEKEKRSSKTSAKFSIGDDMRGLRPMSVSLFGDKREVSSFRDVVRAICDIAYAHNTNAFENLASVDDVNGSEHRYFSKNPENIDEPEELSFNNKEFYVDVAKLAMNNMLFLRKALKQLGIDERNVKIEINPDYQRKPRETKREEETEEA